MRRTLVLLLCTLTLLLCAAPVQAERRTALVIGNSAYKTAPLKNPVNDARDMASALRSLGFEVALVTDATQQQMENAVREFGTRLRQGGVGLFYYAGHGVQVGGENFLIPVNAAILSEADVKYGSVNAGLVLAKMEDAGNGLNLVILDACRSNPYARGFRSAEQGLAKMDAPTGSLIAYATAPGSVASDGGGRNGVFTRHLLETIKTPGLPISEVFMRVRQGVVQETARKQVPWEASSLIGQFYFAGPGQTATPPPAVTAPQPATKAPEEKKDKNLAELFSDFFKSKEETPVATAPAPPTPTASPPAPVQAAAPTAPAPPAQPDVDLQDLREKAKLQAEAEAENRRKWAAWQGAMRKAVAEAQALEKNKTISAADKLEAWTRVGRNFSGDNPYDEGSQKLYAVVQAQTEYWTRMAQKEAARRAKNGPKQAALPPPAKEKELSPAELQALADDGETAYVNRDYTRALPALQAAAAAGNAKAQALLGLSYANGYAVVPDSAAAVKWLRLAAEQNDPRGQNGLGVAYFKGFGVPQDQSEAARLYRLAAEQGLALAQANLGWAYLSGSGLPKNPVEGLRWLRLGASQNNPYAQNGLGVAYASGNGVPQSYSEALKWFQLAAAQALARAQASLGVMHLEGYGVKRDISEAHKWLSLAADQGDDLALYQLGQMSMRGIGVAQSYAEAVRWLTPSAQQGNAQASASLGWIYYKGLSGERSMVQAHVLFSRAVARGFPAAQRDLENIAKGMTTAELAEAQRAASSWQPKTPAELGFAQR